MIGAAALVVIIAAVIVIVSIPSEFERVNKELARYTIGTGDSFSIDTMLYDYNGVDPDIAAYLLADYQENALDAIKHANKELGFSYTLYDDMLSTSMLMGRQSEENDKYKVTWSYHPDEGLVVTYTKK